MSGNSDAVFIDIHCHHASDDAGLALISFDVAEFNPQLAERQVYSLGLHPWFIEQQDWQVSLQTVVNHRNLLAIGECGLDKAINTPLELQMQVFKQQIQLAKQWNKPLIIHCVRAFNEIIQLKQVNPDLKAWIIHGYNGKPPMAQQLIKHGFYLSLGKALLTENSNAQHTLSILPLERLFLETDAANDISISAIYAAAAKIAEIDVSTLKQQILANFQRVFLHD
ncbi:MAG: TatD family hydrolase [Methylomonas sp.]